MSVGIGAGDIVGVAKFAWQTFQYVRESRENFEKLNIDVECLLLTVSSLRKGDTLSLINQYVKDEPEHLHELEALTVGLNSVVFPFASLFMDYNDIVAQNNQQQLNPQSQAQLPSQAHPQPKRVSMNSSQQTQAFPTRDRIDQKFVTNFFDSSRISSTKQKATFRLPQSKVIDWGKRLRVAFKVQDLSALHTRFAMHAGNLSLFMNRLSQFQARRHAHETTSKIQDQSNQIIPYMSTHIHNVYQSLTSQLQSVLLEFQRHSQVTTAKIDEQNELLALRSAESLLLRAGPGYTKDIKAGTTQFESEVASYVKFLIDGGKPLSRDDLDARKTAGTAPRSSNYAYTQLPAAETPQESTQSRDDKWDPYIRLRFGEQAPTTRSGPQPMRARTMENRVSVAETAKEKAVKAAMEKHQGDDDNDDNHEHEYEEVILKYPDELAESSSEEATRALDPQTGFREYERQRHSFAESAYQSEGDGADEEDNDTTIPNLNLDAQKKLFEACQRLAEIDLEEDEDEAKTTNYDDKHPATSQPQLGSQGEETNHRPSVHFSGSPSILGIPSSAKSSLPAASTLPTRPATTATPPLVSRASSTPTAHDNNNTTSKKRPPISTSISSPFPILKQTSTTPASPSPLVQSMRQTQTPGSLTPAPTSSPHPNTDPDSSHNPWLLPRSATSTAATPTSATPSHHSAFALPFALNSIRTVEPTPTSTPVPATGPSLTNSPATASSSNVYPSFHNASTTTVTPPPPPPPPPFSSIFPLTPITPSSPTSASTSHPIAKSAKCRGCRRPLDQGAMIYTCGSGRCGSNNSHTSASSNLDKYRLCKPCYTVSKRRCACRWPLNSPMNKSRFQGPADTVASMGVSGSGYTGLGNERTSFSSSSPTLRPVSRITSRNSGDISKDRPSKTSATSSSSASASAGPVRPAPRTTAYSFTAQDLGIENRRELFGTRVGAFTNDSVPTPTSPTSPGAGFTKGSGTGNRTSTSTAYRFPGMPEYIERSPWDNLTSPASGSGGTR